MNKFNDLKLYRGATSVIELDFTGFAFAENSKCQLTIEKKYNNDVIYQHDFDKPIKYYITFKDEFTANLDDDEYKYDIMYMLNDERYPQCEISDIYMEKVINNYNGEVNPDAVEVTEVLIDDVEISDTIKINNTNVIVTTDSKLQEISVIPTKEEQIILPQEDYNGISKVIVEKISDEYIIPTGTKEITTNGVHNIAEFESANINVNPNLEEGRATPTKEEQVITPNEDYDGFSKVIVDPIPNEYIIPTGTLDVKTNGTHDVTNKESVNVDVQPSLQDKKVTVKPTDNIYVMPDEDYYGLSYVNVIGAVDTENVEVTPTKEVQTINRSEDKYIESVKVNPIPDEYIVPSGELEITENGQYDVTDKVSVNVEITSIGGGDLSEYFNTNPETIEAINSDPFLVNHYFKKLPDLVIPDNTTKINYLFSSSITNEIYTLPVLPKVIANNNITDLKNAFSYIGGSIGVTEIDLSGVDTENVTTMYDCFYNSRGLKEINLSMWNTKSLTDIYRIFYGCSGLTKINLNGWDTSKITSAGNAFYDCTRLEEINLDGWTLSNNTSLSNMFTNCKALRNINLLNFDVSNVTHMSSMFSGCSSLTNLDLSTWITSKLSNVSTMFRGCINLTHIDIRNFDFTKTTNNSNMFGDSASDGVPDDCLIIVKDETAKEWVISKFSRLTNVKTVAEYEAG